MSEVKKTIQPLQGGQIEHPEGLLVRIPPKAFSRRTLVKVSPMRPLPSDKADMALTNLGVTFQMSSSYPLEKPVDVVFRVQASVAQDMQAKNGVAFVEVRRGLASTLTVGKLTKRAELIKRTLQSLVGRFRIPVFIAHSGHAWNVFGVDHRGYWSHGQNPSADNLSDWCQWDRADWLENELKLAADPDEQPHDWFVIKYPTNCRLRPLTKRLGSIALQGSGDTIDYIRFVELGDFPSLAWTPFISPGHPGISYLWIESAVPLDRDGRPTVRRGDTWNDALGYRVPVPENAQADCDCHKDEGCPRCRTRLQLPFWVNNLTKDELHRYRVDLYFWTAGRRWVSINAAPIQPLATPVGDRTFPIFPDWYPDKYVRPSPGPSQEFEIQATPDTTPQAAGRRHPLNWRPMAWYVDFNSNQLGYDTVHGIKLVLVCTDRESDARCVIQDVKQIWFRTLPVGVD